jgi:hypothetical protein
MWLFRDALQYPEVLSPSTESLLRAAKILSHLGRWDRNFSDPTFFEVGGIDSFSIPLLSRQVG